MKKIILSTGLLLLSFGIVMAQGKKNKKAASPAEKPQTVSTAAPAPPPLPGASSSSLTVDNMEFTEAVYDFGTIPEGPDATCKFVFKNTGKEPIIVQKAQASCGCTVPSYQQSPVFPGDKGTIDVAYHTKGKPNAFSKTITVVSNAGTKVLTIKGTVEKAPTSSVPENSSMIKTN